MAELTISAGDIQSAIEEYVGSFTSDTAREEVGTVVDAGDGIAHVEGLPSVMTQELLEFPGGVLGVALNLDEHNVGAVILGDFEKIEEGQQVKRTGEVLSVPVGDAFLGRVVNPLGQPIDGQGDIETDVRRALEIQAPSVVQRQSVKEPLQTGIKAIDAMTPIGRGQRQLIIGDRKTGKTAVCVDTILNQRQNWESGDERKQVRCVYVAIGQKGTTIASVRRALEEGGAMDYTTIARYASACLLRSSKTISTCLPSYIQCCCAARPAARPTRVTCSTCTQGFWSVAPSFPTNSVAAR